MAKNKAHLLFSKESEMGTVHAIGNELLPRLPDPVFGHIFSFLEDNPSIVAACGENSNDIANMNDITLDILYGECPLSDDLVAYYRRS